MPEKKKFDKSAYDREYAKKNYKRIPLDVRIDFYERIRAAAESAKMPLNTYIKAAIEEKMSR